MDSPVREATTRLRAAALELHRLLVQLQRREHEREHGPVATPALLFDLVVRDAAFAWLHPLSELIVAIDQLLELPEMTDVDAAAVRAELETVLASEASGFQPKYRDALQEPEIVMAHATLRQALIVLPETRAEDAAQVAAARARWTAPRRRRRFDGRH